MRYLSIMQLCLTMIEFGCKESTTSPSQADENLLTNSTFELTGSPSLYSWVVSDSSNVRFSTDTPFDGSGRTIALDAQWFAPWPNGSIYQIVVQPTGTHRYRLSIFGKSSGVAGFVEVNLARPSNNGSILRMSLQISDTIWTFYSLTDTITMHVSDSLFITISGGGTEILRGTSYFNTCKFEKLE